MKRYKVFARLITLLLAASVVTVGQMSKPIYDPDFDTKVDNPAYMSSHPKVLIDEAHYNQGLTTERYHAFVELIRHDGYEVTVNNERFSRESLKGHQILIIVNAAGAKGLEQYDAPAFTKEECDAVRDWVELGGSLLLIAGTSPYGKAAENLAKEFSVNMSNGRVTDEANKVPQLRMYSILFTRAKKLLADHDITQGRNPHERINQAVVYSGGQSLKGPVDSVALLSLADSAIEAPGTTTAELKAAMQAPAQGVEGAGPTRPSNGVFRIPAKEKVSAAGRSMAVALTYGKGRVVVFGEAEMFAAKLIQGPPAQSQGKESIPFGMNAPGNDNRQLALNTMHWLSSTASSNTISREIAPLGSLKTAQEEGAIAPRKAPLPREKQKRLAQTFSVETLDGHRFDLASLRGKIVVLNFWFTGCGPCIAEMPDMNRLVEDFKNKDVVFLSLAWDDEIALRKFMKGRDFRYNLAGGAFDIITTQYGVEIFPAHIIIDREGRIALESLGKSALKDLRRELEHIVGNKGT